MKYKILQGDCLEKLDELEENSIDCIVTDPPYEINFMGSGSTGKACAYENKERDADYRFIGIEQDPEYCKIAEARIAYVAKQ